MKISSGTDAVLGASLCQDGCNFAVHSPEAHQVFLCLFDTDEEQIAEIPMPAKTGDVWHCHVGGIQSGQLYAYRAVGTYAPEGGLCFDKEKLLIDPYAKALNKPLFWVEEDYRGDSQQMIPKGIVGQEQFDWQGVSKPKVPASKTVIYEAHVKGLTALNSSVPEALRGTYLGACDPNIIEHLKSLGITTVQFLPVFAFMPEVFITNKGLTNYWGYNPVNFFSPEPRYAKQDAVLEFKHMVREFHRAGIEVILDVVYNHTAEAGFDGPTLSFKGLDNRSFYLFPHNEFGATNYAEPTNNSGCGNSINLTQPYAYQLVMDSLRYWVEEMQIDGFRFDLAASLCREPEEFSLFAGFLRMVKQEPTLSQVKLIAEPWDVGLGGYRLGQFPVNWHEVNDKYRDTVRAFWRGDKGITSEFATRLLGSRDVFHKGKRSIHSSINHVTYHDGFTLQDLVSYKERHNLDNLESNRDGHGHNLSENYGVEGETDDCDIIQLREKQKRNLFATLLLSQGIPHVLGGDELSRTQMGNNNAYCHDNEISWVDWNLDKRQSDFLGFCQKLIKLRQESRILSDLQLRDDAYTNTCNVETVGWYKPDGSEKTADDWHDPDNQAFMIDIQESNNQENVKAERWLLLFNASEHEVSFALPAINSNGFWRFVVDTRYSEMEQKYTSVKTGFYALDERSMSVLLIDYE